MARKPQAAAAPNRSRNGRSVNMRVGKADLPVAPYTTDGDLAIATLSPSKASLLEQMLTQADFLSKD